MVGEQLCRCLLQLPVWPLAAAGTLEGAAGRGGRHRRSRRLRGGLALALGRRLGHRGCFGRGRRLCLWHDCLGRSRAAAAHGSKKLGLRPNDNALGLGSVNLSPGAGARHQVRRLEENTRETLP